MDRAKSSSYWMVSLKTKVRVLKKYFSGGKLNWFFFSKLWGKCFKGRSRTNICTRLFFHPLWVSETAEQNGLNVSSPNPILINLNYSSLGYFAPPKYLILISFYALEEEKLRDMRGHGRRGNMEGFAPQCMSPSAFLLYISCTLCLMHW